MKLKKILIAVLLQCTLLACSSFAFQYYGMQMTQECYSSGHLLGSDASKDLPLSICEPDAQIQGKCVVMEIAEFDRLRTHLADVETQLKACQSQ